MYGVSAWRCILRADVFIQRQQLVIRVSEIGRSLLHAAQTTGPTPDGKQAQESVRWLQKAFSLVESIEALPEVPELKVRSVRPHVSSI